MGIGAYRQIVTLTGPAGPAVAEPEGGFTAPAAPLVPATWHCAIEVAGLRDLERIGGGTVSATTTHLLRGRYHAGITAASTVTWGARTFAIESVRDRDGRGIETIALARELVPGG